MPLRTLVGLILCNLIWSANPTMGKLVLADFSPPLAAWLRYSGALLAYLAGVIALRFLGRMETRERFGRPFLGLRVRGDLFLVVLLGFLTFFFSPLTQFSGLAGSRATENSLIIAMEPLFTVFLAWVFLKERMSRIHVLAFFLAIVGFSLLAELPKALQEQGWHPHFLANLVLLVSLIGEASYSVLGRKLMHRHQALSVFGTSLAVGVGFLTMGVLFLAFGRFAGFTGIFLQWPTHVGWGSVLALLWLGPLGTTLSYLYWMQVLSEAPVATMVLTLFIQPVVGAVWGMFFLDERLTLSQDFGGFLIIAAVSVPTLFAKRLPAK